MTRYSNTMRDILSQIREGYSPKEIKMAIGIASDKRYKGGNMTGAVNAIEKIKKGLSDHPQVRAVLQRVNEAPEDMEPASPDEGSMALDQLKFMSYAANKMMEHIQGGGEFPEWMQNKLSGTHEKMKSLYANIEHGEMKEEVELEEGKSSTGYELYHKDFSSAMKHAYDFAKKKFGIEVDPKEIDDKVASGPRKPSKGKTNSYRLLGKDGKKAIQVQVYGMDNGKYELNMYKESVELEEKLKVSDGLGAWIDDFKKSDAPQFQGKSDEEKKNMAIAAFTDAGGKLDEGMVDDLAKEFEKRVKKQGHSSRTQDRERMAVLGMAKKKGASPADMKKLDAAIVSIIDKLNEEVELDEVTNKFAIVSVKNGDVIGFSSDEKDANSMARNNLRKEKGKVVKLKRGISSNRASKMIGRPLEMGLAEEQEPQKPDSAKAVDQMRDDKKKTRIAQLQLQIAKAQETINKLNAQEKPSE